MIRAKRTMPGWRTGVWPLCLAVLACGAIGCDSVDRAKTMISDVPLRPAQVKATETANMELTVGTPEAAKSIIKTADCQAQLIGLPDRPAILQVASSADPTRAAMPSVFLRSALTASVAADLAAGSISAEAFVQETADSPIWHSSREEPVELKIVEIGADFVKGEFTGTLISSQTQESVPVSGKLNARLSRVGLAR